MPETGFYPSETNTATAEAPDGRTYCAVHPEVETSLRCNKCGRYMCSRCAVRTPVGYRCKQCVHQQQDVYFTATQRDYAIAAVVAFVLSLPASYIIPRIFLFGVIILSLPAGGLIGEIVFRATGRRRGRYVWVAAAAGIVAGAVVVFFPTVRFILAQSSRAGLGAEAPLLLGGELILPLVYLALCVGGAIARLRYGK